MSAFLKVSGLEFSYGEVKVLYGLDLEVSANSISCVMGRNGVGKTTFLAQLGRVGETLRRNGDHGGERS